MPKIDFGFAYLLKNHVYVISRPRCCSRQKQILWLFQCKNDVSRFGMKNFFSSLVSLHTFMLFQWRRQRKRGPWRRQCWACSTPSPTSSSPFLRRRRMSPFFKIWCIHIKQVFERQRPTSRWCWERRQNIIMVSRWRGHTARIRVDIYSKYYLTTATQKFHFLERAPDGNSS